MKHEDRQRIAQTLAGVYGFYGQELTPFAVRVWADALSDVPVGDAERAFFAHLKDPQRGHWCPKPADILRQLRGSTDDDAQLQWGLVLAAVRNGGEGVEKLDASALEALSTLGGTSVIGRTDESHNGFLQRRFVDAYLAHRALLMRESAALTADAMARIGSPR